ncbi:MAG: saccharopine dehydrogenase, partial [Hyphomicrobiales bacterium]
MTARAHILIVGASGTFGSRLARMLAQRQAFRLSLGGRDEAKVRALQAELHEIDPQGEYAFVRIDRDQAGPDLLREIGCWLVVDCAGPFQGSGTALIEAAIAARCNYIDLADSRAFVADIKGFDGPARAANVAVLTGASSTPALTHAVLETITAGWRQVDTIDVAILPGNRTPKGRSVIHSILSWVGQKVRVFHEGQWQEARGWSGTRLARVEGLKPRRAALADVPDLDLLVSRFRPRIRARIDAGMELWILHWLIAMSGLCVRLRLVKSAQAFVGIGTWIAQTLERFGTSEGGMVIEVTGLDQRLDTKMVRWSLKAEQGHGPYVPVIPAAATIWALARGQTVTGARPAIGLLDIEALKPWMDGLALSTKTSAFKREIPLFARVMGESFSTLPEVTRRLHRGRPAITAEG